MTVQTDEHGNQIPTFDSGARAVLPARQVLLNKRQAALDKASAQAVRETLALEPDWGRTCGANYLHCGCHHCARYGGFYAPEEKEQAFTPPQRALIDSMWDNEKGFLGERGCRLPRLLRSMACLQNICAFDTNLKKYQLLYLSL